MTILTAFSILSAIKQYILQTIFCVITHLCIVSYQVHFAILLMLVSNTTNAGQPDTLKTQKTGKIQLNDTAITITALSATDATADTAMIKQEKTDTLTVIRKKHTPAKAALLSAALPGMGQAYNKKYWKIPIIYAGFAGLGYWIGHNTKNYKTFREAYRLRIDDDSLTIDRFTEQYSSGDLKILKDFYKRNLDLSVILTIVWYSLNIIDAAVDAHLFEFDVSDNLSMRIEPHWQYQGQRNFAGIKLHFAMKPPHTQRSWYFKMNL